MARRFAAAVPEALPSVFDPNALWNIVNGQCVPNQDAARRPEALRRGQSERRRRSTVTRCSKTSTARRSFCSFRRPGSSASKAPAAGARCDQLFRRGVARPALRRKGARSRAAARQCRAWRSIRCCRARRASFTSISTACAPMYADAVAAAIARRSGGAGPAGRAGHPYLAMRVMERRSTGITRSSSWRTAYRGRATTWEAHTWSSSACNSTAAPGFRPPRRSCRCAWRRCRRRGIEDHACGPGH